MLMLITAIVYNAYTAASAVTKNPGNKKETERF
jgi:hypothetical protein